jgi:hypothetical protein
LDASSARFSKRSTGPSPDTRSDSVRANRSKDERGTGSQDDARRPESGGSSPDLDPGRSWIRAASTSALRRKANAGVGRESSARKCRRILWSSALTSAKRA